MTKRGRPQNVVFDKASGRGMTINQFTKRSAKEMRRLCLTRSEIVKRKLLTKSVLGKAVKDGRLKETIYGKKRYIYRTELNNFISQVVKKKLIFIAHPIRGDVAGNMAKVLSICEQVHKEGHIPVAPYLVSLQYLNDEVVEDRELGVEANLVCFHRGFVDELWLYGDKISEGMKREIALAKELKIPVVAKTEVTKKDLELLDVLK